MAGLMDILLALVKVLCGGSTTEERPSVEHQKPHTQRPPHQQTTSTRLEQYPIPERPPAKYQKPHTQWPPHQQTTSTRPEQYPIPERPPAEYQKPHTQRPPRQQTTSPRPEQYPIPEQEQELKPISQPRPDHRPHQNQNQINQHDERYMALRAKANGHGDLMARCFQESHEAYSRGDGARAKELSEEGKQHERTMEGLNAKASAWIFRQNNLDGEPGEIDLHGLYVKEAISYVDKSVREARERGDAEIRFIVGKGLHSDGHVAKVKPAVEDYMGKHNIPIRVDPYNAGVLVARLL